MEPLATISGPNTKAASSPPASPTFAVPTLKPELPPLDWTFPRRGSVPHISTTGGLLPPTPHSAEGRPRSSSSVAAALAGIGVLPPTPSSAYTPSPLRSARGFGPATPLMSNKLHTPRTPSVSVSSAVKLGPVPAPGTRIRNSTPLELSGGSEGPVKRSVATLPGSDGPAPTPGPPSGRRGHAHRRSGAISSSDVWQLLSQSQSTPSLPLAQPSPSPKSSTSDGLKASPLPTVSVSAPVSPGGNASPSRPSPPLPAESNESNAKKGKVAFIDKVEYIPRPMSSGTTASEQNGARGHGPSDSISSISSSLRKQLLEPPSPTTPLSPRTRSHSHSSVKAPPLVIPDQRPSTAGAILDSPSLTPASSKPSSLKKSGTAVSRTESDLSQPSTPLSPDSKKSHKKSHSDFGLPFVWDSKKSSDSTDPARTEKNTEENMRLTAASPTDSLQDFPRPKQKSKKKKGKKHPIKNWLGKSVLGRHSKVNRQLKRLPLRAPTPPLPRTEERFGGAQWVAEWNESYVIVPPSAENFETFGFGSMPPAESEKPVIDLDAALGPFQTPQNTRGNFMAARKWMHSSGGKSPAGVFNPGFAFHKRSESMPETTMQLFALEEAEDGMEMEDVFEETDEDSSEDEASLRTGSAAAKIGIKVEDVDSPNESTESLSLKRNPYRQSAPPNLGCTSRRGSGSSSRSQLSVKGLGISLKARTSGTSLRSEDPISPVVEEEESNSPGASSPSKAQKDKFRLSAVTCSTQSSSSTVTPTTVNALAVPEPAQMSSAASTPLSVPSTPYQDSLYASTDNISVLDDAELEAYRKSHDGNGSFIGEPGPEFRVSTDDVPSLTSCSSTMTGREPPTPGIMDEGKKKEKKRWSRVFSGLFKLKEKEKEKERN